MRPSSRVTLVTITLVLAPLASGCTASEVADEETSEDGLTAEQIDTKRVEAIRKVAILDVEASQIKFARREKSPVRSPSSGYRSPAGPSLYGVDWFQKWPGGVSADHNWDNGTEYGKRCMWAATLRFEAIMKEPPAELKAFLAEYGRWSGSFYNWVDDYSKPESFGDASGASLWAWRTGLSKWITGAKKDGSCYLPTRKMVIEYVKACKDHQARNNGEMEGCRR
jgi:hypothetical protein